MIPPAQKLEPKKDDFDNIFDNNAAASAAPKITADAPKNAYSISGAQADAAPSNSQFQRKTCFSEGFEKFITAFKYCAACLSLVNCVLDIVYAYNTTYVIPTIFLATLALILVKVVFVIGVGQYYYHIFVRMYKPNLGETVEHKVVADEDQPEFDEKS